MSRLFFDDNKLPAGITSTSSYSDFNYLLVQYGIATNYVGASTNATWSPDNTNGYLNIQKDPLYILRSGYFYSSSLVVAGVNGYLRSSTASGSANDYRLYFDSSNVHPAYSNNRGPGIPVRCKSSRTKTLQQKNYKIIAYLKSLNI